MPREANNVNRPNALELAERILNHPSVPGPRENILQALVEILQPVLNAAAVQPDQSDDDVVGELFQSLHLNGVTLEGDNPRPAMRAIIARHVASKVAAQKGYTDGAYAERNQLVAGLSKLYPAGQKKTAIEGWDETWHNCIYIDLPTGQVSWHIHDNEMAQFVHLPPYAGEWDGHDTPEKYRRLAALTAQPATDAVREVMSSLIKYFEDSTLVYGNPQLSQLLRDGSAALAAYPERRTRVRGGCR